MSIWMIISIVLSLFCLWLFFHLSWLKREIRIIQKELSLTRKQSYNRQLTVTLYDRDLTNMAVELNCNLDYQRQLKLKTKQEEEKIKQSISDIAHDLRTPLTVVKGNLQMIDAGQMKEQDKNYLNICHDKLEVLKIMVDDFFEMSVLESDSTPVNLTVVNATNTLMQFVVDNETLIREHGLCPDIRLPEKSVVILADLRMFERMLGNLLNNVMKYAMDSFIISMEINDSGENPVCRITFSNRIIRDLDLDVEHLFDRTYRGNQERHGNGAGLGLYIVKLLAIKQEAKVSAEKDGDMLAVRMEFQMKETMD